MTRQRIYGSDVPFMGWARRCELLPSISLDCGVVLTDVDCFVHRYLTSVDRLGTRDVQAMMEIEVKSRNGRLTDSQADTYRKKHITVRKCSSIDGQAVFNYGVGILRMSGTDPDNSDQMQWGRFMSRDGRLNWQTIDLASLISLMRFEIDPDSLKPLRFRRHHHRREYDIIEKTPLGFSVSRKIIHGS